MDKDMFVSNFQEWLNKEIKSKIKGKDEMSYIVYDSAFKHLICPRMYDTHNDVDVFLEHVMKKGEVIGLYDEYKIIIELNNKNYAINCYGLYKKFCDLCYEYTFKGTPATKDNIIWEKFMPSRWTAFKFQRWLNQEIYKLYESRKQRVSEKIYEHLS